MNLAIREALANVYSLSTLGGHITSWHSLYGTWHLVMVQGRITSPCSRCHGSVIARFKGPIWGPPGADRTQVGPMLAAWTLLSGMTSLYVDKALSLRHAPTRPQWVNTDRETRTLCCLLRWQVILCSLLENTFVHRWISRNLWNTQSAGSFQEY